MIQDLLKSEEIHSKIEALMRYARENVISLDEMIEAQANNKPVGTTPERVLEFGEGYRVVFSLEDQPAGLAKHISVSKDRMKPPLEDLLILLKEFGFQFDASNINNKSQVYLESYDVVDKESGKKTHREAINVIELDEEEFDKWFEV